MKIGELAALSGTTVETVRFYEGAGLLPAPHRNTSNYRCYDETHLERLRFIRSCRDLDLSLDKIKALITVNETDVPCDAAHAVIRAHLDEIERKMLSLESLRERLIALQNRCKGHTNHNDCGLLEGLRRHA
jgi:DNA-binding transcriptional MerR regulator